MRTLGILAAGLCCLVLACGGGSPSTSACQHDFDCPAGQGCVSNTCVALPCGGCQPDQACSNGGTCVKAQGAACASNTCPSGYPCNSVSQTCSKPCTLNNDCDTGSVCNSGLQACAQCTFNTDCAQVTGATKCNSTTGQCVQCNVDLDCTQSLGSGHFCNNHVCAPGCSTNDDCNSSNGETCDTTQTPGKCIQCKTNQDCLNSFGGNAPACDSSGKCVQCTGTSQSTASANYCGGGTPECNLTTETCVACVPANNDSGTDCGFKNGGTFDPHFESVCDPKLFACTDGCADDNQCGCPRSGGTETACPRYAVQEHCDTKRTSSADKSDATQGACVECTTDAQCAFTVTGNTQYGAGNAYAKNNGARCVNDSCVEGCDTDLDCFPDHATSNGLTCHIGGGSNVDHKCVQCACNTLSPDGTYCEGSGQSGCTGNDVCDSQTLSCRLKRLGETCTAGSQCGDTTDPRLNGCIGSSAACVFSIVLDDGIGATKYCSGTPNVGKCGIPCDDDQNNQCNSGAGLSCPSGSTCQRSNQVSPENSGGPTGGTFCAANSCSFSSQ